MTVQDMMKWAYMDSGEPSDMCPYTDPGDELTFDIARTESQRLLVLLNAAYRRIANWRFRSGRQIYHTNLFCRDYISVRGTHVDTVISASPSTVIIAGISPNTAGMFKKWNITVTDQITGEVQERFVIDSALNGTDIQLTVNTEWDTIPDSSTGIPPIVELSRNFVTFVSPTSTAGIDAYNVKIDPTSTLQDILKIRDMDTSSDLTRVDNIDIFTGSFRTPGVPTQFRRYGKELWFDAVITENKTYEILYTCLPPVLSAATDVPVISEMYHQAIVLWAVHDIQRRNQDLTGAYATKRELEDLMEMLYIQGSADMMFEQGGITTYG